MIARLLLLAVLAGAIMPASASAHATIVRTSPSDQAVLKTQPREVTLEWSEAVDLGEHAVRLLDGSGEEVKTGAAKHGPGGPSTAVLALPPGLADGTYVVAWRVVSCGSLRTQIPLLLRRSRVRARADPAAILPVRIKGRGR